MRRPGGPPGRRSVPGQHWVVQAVVGQPPPAAMLMVLAALTIAETPAQTAVVKLWVCTSPPATSSGGSASWTSSSSGTNPVLLSMGSLLMRVPSSVRGGLVPGQHLLVQAVVGQARSTAALIVLAAVAL